MRSLASISVQLVAWIALTRCAGVLIAVVRQALRLKQTVVTKWGWVETLAAPEPFLMAAFACLLLTGDGAPHRNEPAHVSVALLGGALAVVGISVWGWAFATIPSLSSGHYVLPGQQVVTQGPYAWVRHPIYSAVVVLWLALAVASTSGAIVAITAVYVAPVYVLYARSEERMMLAQFGDTYRRYQQSTGMLVPGLRRSRNGNRKG